MNSDNVTFEIYLFTFQNLMMHSVIPVIISRARSKLIKKFNLGNIRENTKCLLLQNVKVPLFFKIKTK